MVEKLRFGLVGCGVIGPLHAEAIASLPDAQLDAVTDVMLERAEKLARPYGARAYTDMQVMLARERLDVVTICTPSGMHGEHACCAMCAGCHVIVEKPMEIRLEAIDEMLRVQKEQGVKLAVISQHRFDPATQQVKALIDEGALGRLVLGNAQVPWWRSQAYYESGDWRGTWRLDGGGVLMNQSIHYVDLLQWLMGPVRSIRAYTDTLVHRMETEDVAVAVLRFASGALGTISATTGGYPGLAARLEFLGDRGSAVIEGDELAFLHLARAEQGAAGAYGTSARTSKAGASSVASNPAAQSSASHALQIADMIRAIREDGTPLVDGYAARRPVEIILGIYESSRTGQEVVLS
jgi:UDP-N-acetyl-2-amino-2-deoxyglucuronate dehydrogenase